MADFTVVVANVKPGVSASSKLKTLGEVGLQGDVVYESSDGKVYLADANDVNKYKVFGILEGAGAADQQVMVLTAGELVIPGFTGLVGQVVILSATPGKMAPVADLSAGWYCQILGVLNTTTVMKMNLGLRADSPKA